MKSLAARIHAFGTAADAVELEAVELADPADGEILVEMLAAPINPADINVIEGKYGTLPELPATLGNEGIGRVLSIGANVGGFFPGQLVRPLSPGNWCERRVVRAKGAEPVPEGVDVLQGSMLTVNPPAAYGLLTSFARLSRGDWVVQNAANSGVGRCIIQIARRMQIHTLNVVRRQELADELLDLGADVVITEETDLRARTAEFTGGALPRLALNAVGGASALNAANALAFGGTHVTYGAMGRKPLKIPNNLLLFRGLIFRGFWLKMWRELTPPDEYRAANELLAGMALGGSLRVPIASTYPLSRVGDAVAHAMRDRRGGKILLLPSG